VTCRSALSNAASLSRTRKSVIPATIASHVSSDAPFAGAKTSLTEIGVEAIPHGIDVDTVEYIPVESPVEVLYPSARPPRPQRSVVWVLKNRQIYCTDFFKDMYKASLGRR
jgi:hypothetical protein